MKTYDNVQTHKRKKNMLFTIVLIVHISEGGVPNTWLYTILVIKKAAKR